MQPSQIFTRLASGTGLTARLGTILGLVIWLLCIQSTVLPVAILRDAAVGLLGLYLLVNYRQVQGWVWRIAGACTLVTCIALATGSPLVSVYQGMDMALIFMGFMPAIALIGWRISRSDLLLGIDRKLAQVPASRRVASTMLHAHIVGAVMAMGAVALLALPFRQVEDQALREAAGLATLRGMGLAVFWTPFTIGMGFTIGHLPAVPMWQVMGCGLLIAVIGLALSLGRLDRRNLAAAVNLMRGPGLAIVAISTALVIANMLTGISGLDIIMLAAPLIVLGHWAVQTSLSRWQGTDVLSHFDGQSDVSAPKALLLEVGGLGNEMMLYVSSLIMGAALSNNPLFLEAISSLELDNLPAPVVFYFMVLLSIFGALLGLHSSLICSVLIAIAAGLVGQFSSLSLFMLVLFGWFCGVLLSISSVSLVIAQRSFRIPLGRFLHGPNLVFTFVLGTVLTLIFALMHAFHFV